ncbi:putative diphthamide synthesis protein-domain-containing protein [Xylariaceae sp. FL0804]|nr:putative diphthamide synthesis protein-domain-containing protein [Xylariaceae sp. FL0804]
MAADLSAPPALSTPAEHTFLEDTAPTATRRPAPSDDELSRVYEVARTAAEVRRRGWRRVALQFPDAMLPDAPRVVDALSRALESAEEEQRLGGEEGKEEGEGEGEGGGTQPGEGKGTAPKETGEGHQRQRLYILADTSYSACCVDEIAAEHAGADAVVHYGRACLSPTSRLPVVHVFTRQALDRDDAAAACAREFPPARDGSDSSNSSSSGSIVVMADVMFQEHVAPVCALLRARGGYRRVLATEIVHDPSATIPNRRVVVDDEDDGAEGAIDLRHHHLFHISTPPTALLLTLSSRLASLRIYPTPSSPYAAAAGFDDAEVPDPSATPGLLRRRYGLVVRLATASVIGILVNTLSVRNYMATIGALRARVAAAGKKSYTVVVGKLNAAKLANFAEVDGWVVVGCWESGLVEHAEGLWRPVVTPFELALALQGEESRVWTGEWWGGIEGVADTDKKPGQTAEQEVGGEQTGAAAEPAQVDEPPDDVEGGVSDEESEPPVFDLRTGKLVSNTRPMKVAVRTSTTADVAQHDSSSGTKGGSSSALARRRPPGELATVNGVVSPGAEFLRSQRTWQGLGSDVPAGGEEEGEGQEEESTVVEQGRSGIARGYTVGEDAGRS